jgi:hypothetical protein
MRALLSECGGLAIKNAEADSVADLSVRADGKLMPLGRPVCGANWAPSYPATSFQAIKIACIALDISQAVRIESRPVRSFTPVQLHSHALIPADERSTPRPPSLRLGGLAAWREVQFSSKQGGGRIERDRPGRHVQKAHAEILRCASTLTGVTVASAVDEGFNPSLPRVDRESARQ